MQVGFFVLAGLPGRLESGVCGSARRLAPFGATAASIARSYSRETTNATAAAATKIAMAITGPT